MYFPETKGVESEYLYDHHQQQQQQQREKEESSETHWCREIASKPAGKAKFLDASDQDTVSLSESRDCNNYNDYSILFGTNTWLKSISLSKAWHKNRSLSRVCQFLSTYEIRSSDKSAFYSGLCWTHFLLERRWKVGDESDGWRTACVVLICFGLLLGMIISRPAWCAQCALFWY